MHIESGLSMTLSRWSDPLRINSIPIWAGMLHEATLTFSHELSRCFHLVGEELDLWKRCVWVSVDHRQWQQLREPLKRVRLQHAMPACRTISPP